MVCEICGDVFKEKLQGVKTVCRKGKCRDEYRKWHNKPNVICVICKKSFYLKSSQVKEFNCCSHSCLNERKSNMYIGKNNPNFNNRGINNPLFKGGVRIKKYRFIYKPEHPFNRDGYVLEHRLVAEKYLLNNENSIVINDIKYLKEDFEVHHLDQDKLNNDINNLMVLTKSEHRRLHNLLNKQKRDIETGKFIK